MRRNGFTLIEFLIVITILAILASLAAPSFTDQMARRRMEGAGVELATDLKFARAQAVSSRGTTTLTTNGTGTGYAVVTAEGTKSVVLPGGLTVTPSTTVTYSYLRGMADADYTLTLSSTVTGATMRVLAGAVGSVHVCSPGGALTGVVSC